MSGNPVVKCITKCLESVAKNTLLNLHYYSNVKQIVFKLYNNKCGCIVGETLNGNMIFIKLDGIYHISEAELLPPLPSINKKTKMAYKDNSCSQIQSNLINESNAQSSEKPQNKENILLKDKLSFDGNKDSIVNPLNKTPKTKKVKTVNENFLSKSITNSINENNTQSREESQYEKTKAKSSLENFPEMPTNIDVNGNLNNKINSNLKRNLQISNINGNSKIEGSGNFKRK